MQRLQDPADDMSRWLVDICNQLGVDEGTAAAAGSGTARHWGSPPTSEARSPSALDVSHAGASHVPLSSVFVPYASTSASSSSPGSSSGESSSRKSSSSSSIGRAKSMRRGAAARATLDAHLAPGGGDFHQQQQLNLTLGLDPEDPDVAEAQKEIAAAEARREKNRLRVRRHYYRKLSLMNDLRAQVSELEERIGGMQQLQLAPGGAEPSERGMYLQQLDTTRRALEQENQQVREILFQQTRQFMLARQQHLQRLLDESQLLGTPMPVPFIVKKRLVPTDCDAIWQRTKRELNSLVIYNEMPAADVSQDSGDSICGWKTTRAVEDGAFKFVFQKLLRDCAPVQALDAAWAVFSDPKQFARLYSPTVDMWCALVQVVDADNVVLFQEHKSMDKDEVHVVMKTILLASRVRNASTGEFGITLRGVEHEQLGLEDLSVSVRDGYEVWNDINSCLQWIPRGEHCECKVSGAIPTVGANAYYWMVEVLFIVMRLEATTASPKFFTPTPTPPSE